MNKKFLIFTGGTGGHVIPAVSFGNHLINNGFNCILLTDTRGKKFTNGFLGKIKLINASHLDGNIFFKILGLFKLLLGFFQCILIIFIFRPTNTLSFGSYASVPACFAVKIIKTLFNINFYIHEQNSIIGKSNLFFLKTASKIFVNFDQNYEIEDRFHKKISIVGLPSLNESNLIKNLDFKKKYNKKFIFFIYGGSQGSIPLLKCFIKLIDNLNSRDLKKIFFVIQCPKQFTNEFSSRLKQYDIKFIISEYFNNLPSLLTEVDLVLSRCGAGTINDIIEYKIPSILIPLPEAKDNHQFENAKYLININCGIMVDQYNFEINKALNFIKLILKDNSLRNQINNRLSNHLILKANELMLKIISNEISK